MSPQDSHAEQPPGTTALKPAGGRASFIRVEVAKEPRRSEHQSESLYWRVARAKARDVRMAEWRLRSQEGLARADLVEAVAKQLTAMAGVLEKYVDAKEKSLSVSDRNAGVVKIRYVDLAEAIKAEAYLVQVDVGVSEEPESSEEPVLGARQLERRGIRLARRAENAQRVEQWKAAKMRAEDFKCSVAIEWEDSGFSGARLRKVIVLALNAEAARQEKLAQSDDQASLTVFRGTDGPIEITSRQFATMLRAEARSVTLPVPGACLA